jgi:hypothetical protein
MALTGLFTGLQALPSQRRIVPASPTAQPWLGVSIATLYRTCWVGLATGRQIWPFQRSKTERRTPGCEA